MHTLPTYDHNDPGSVRATSLSATCPMPGGLQGFQTGARLRRHVDEAPSGEDQCTGTSRAAALRRMRGCTDAVQDVGKPGKAQLIRIEVDFDFKK
jgi:hypothetical protein